MKRVVLIVLALTLIVGATCGCSLLIPKEVKAVDELIANIGEDISLDSGKAIAQAFDAYDALTDDHKAKVTGFETLKAADDKYAKLATAKILNEEKISPEDALGLIEVYNTQNSELADLFVTLENLKNCSGVFYQNGKYETTVTIYLQYGEPWFEIDYPGYTGYITEAKLTEDGNNDFLYKAETTGGHINPLFGNFMKTYFTIRFGEEKLYVEWGSSSYYLSRTK
jgi:hypothetical protein